MFAPPQVAESMRQQRPLAVEIKQKRGLVKRPQSIWAGIDLTAIPKYHGRSGSQNDHRNSLRPSFIPKKG